MEVIQDVIGNKCAQRVQTQKQKLTATKGSPNVAEDDGIPSCTEPSEVYHGNKRI